MAESYGKSAWPIGQFVRSKTGRDCGRYYLIYGVEEKDSYLLLVDGEKRSLQNPKRKNMRHVQVMHKVSLEFSQLIKQGKTVDNAAIRQMLKELNADKTNRKTLKEVGR